MRFGAYAYGFVFVVASMFVFDSWLLMTACSSFIAVFLINWIELKGAISNFLFKLYDHSIDGLQLRHSFFHQNDWTSNRDVEAEAGSGSGGSGKFLWKRKLEAVNGYRFGFHLRCSTILALNVFLTQNKQLKHTITRVCEASCCRKYPLLNSQKFESTAVC